MPIRLTVTLLAIVASFGIANGKPTEQPLADVSSNLGLSSSPEKSQHIQLERRAKGPMEFRVSQQGQNQIIFATGVIVPETPTVFRQFLQDNKITAHRQIIAFDSEGGDLLAAMALGREIRKADFSTFVTSRFNRVDQDNNGKTNAYTISPDKTDDLKGKTIAGNPTVCADACLLAFLGGRARTIEDGEIRFKTYRPPLDEAGTTSGQELDIRKQQLIEIAYIYDYANEMEFDPSLAFIDWRDAGPHVFTSSEWDQYKLNFAPDIIDNWRLKPRANGLQLEAKSHDGSLKFVFYCVAQNSAAHVTISSSNFSDLSQPDYDKITSYQLFGQTLPAAAATITANAANFDLDLSLNPIKPEHFNGDAAHILAFTKDDASKPVLKFDLAGQDQLKRLMEIALRNCL